MAQNEITEVKKITSPEEMRSSFIQLMNSGEYATAVKDSKATVFTDFFEKTENGFELFKVLHPEDSTITEADIDIVTLKNVTVNMPYNDLGILAKDRFMILVEAQSTWSVNILVRILIYLAYTYKNYITAHELDIYASRRIELPKPEFYVIYTGTGKRPEEIRFSSEFFNGEVADVEIRAKVISDSKQGDVIDQYIRYTHELDKNITLYGRTRKAVEETVRYCIANDILRNYFLEKGEMEVIDLMMVLFDDDVVMRNHDATIRRETREETQEEDNLSAIRKLMKHFNITIRQAMSILEIPEEKQEIYISKI